MQDFNLLIQNPFFYIVAVILLIIIIIQGRSLKTPFFSIGSPKNKKSPQNGPNIQVKPTINQNPTITQNPTININTGSFSQEQLEEIIIQAIAKANIIREEVNNKLPNFLYQPPKLPEKILYIISTKFDVEAKIRNIVLDWGGGWAGCSLTGVETYLDLTRQHKIIPEKVVEDFEFLEELSKSILFQGYEPSDETFLTYQYLAMNLSESLNFELNNIREKKLGNG